MTNFSGNRAGPPTPVVTPDILLGVQPDSQLTMNTVRHAFYVLHRFRIRSVAFFALVMTLVVLALVYWPRTYSSESKLLVRVGRSSVSLDPTVATGQTIALQNSRTAEIASALEVLQSRTILEPVVDSPVFDGPYDTPLEREKAIIGFGRSLSVEMPDGSNVISVACSGESPEQAQERVEAVIDRFLDEHLRLNSTPGSFEFFEEQTKEIKSQWDAAALQLREAKDACSLTSIEDRRKVLEEQLGEVQLLAVNNQAQLVSAQAKIAAFKGDSSESLDTLVREFAVGLPTAESNATRQQLIELQRTEKELLSRYKPTHPEVLAVQSQLKALAAEMNSDRLDRSQATSANLLTEVVNEAAYRAEKSSLTKRLEQLRHEMTELNRHETVIRDLQRETEMLDAKYQRYVDNMEQTRIERELEKDEMSNIRVIQPASFAVKPTSPRKGLTLAFGMMVATCGAIGLAFVSERLDSSLRYTRQIEGCLGVPVLTTIPKMRRELKIREA